MYKAGFSCLIKEWPIPKWHACFSNNLIFAWILKALPNIILLLKSSFRIVLTGFFFPLWQIAFFGKCFTSIL